MKITIRRGVYPRAPISRQMLLQMKLTTLFLTAFLVQVSARSLSQNVTFSGTNVSLEKVFSAIEKQTGYVFFYNSSDIVKAGPVSVSLKDASLQAALRQCLVNQPLGYVIKGNTIFINASKATLATEPEDLLFLPPPPVAELKGRVLNAAGQPVEGAAVSLPSLNKGTTTDRAGSFILTGIPAGSYTLEVSYVGYQRYTQVVNVGAKGTGIAITLQEADNNLSDVAIAVNTGYQKLEKYQLTGAASVLSQKQYDQRVAVTGNFLESLEGKLPGLVYNSQSGELSIRGVSTFDAVKQPLIVVDGFPTEIDIRTINPIDIVSVTVLRDAAASSIYGVRASNGVIIIETRRGKQGKPAFSLRATTAFQPAPDFSYLKYAPADEYAQLQVEQFRKANPSEATYITYGYAKTPVQEVMFDLKANRITQAQADQRLAAIKSYDNLQEYEQLFYCTRQATNLDFDMSGGNDRSTYLLGINYVGEKPVKQRSNSNQFIVNLANTYKLSERINFDFRGIYTNSKSSNGGDVPYTDFFPYERLADDNGNALAVALGPNKDYLSYVANKQRNDRLVAAGLYDQRYAPYGELAANTTTNYLSAIRFQGRLQGKVTEWLSAELGGTYENQQGTQDNLRTEQAFAVRYLLNSRASKDPSSGKPLFVDIPQGNILGKTQQKTTSYTVRGQLNFHKKIGSVHDFSGIAGIEQRKTVTSAFKTTYFGYNGQTLLSKPVNWQRLNSSNSPAFADVGSFGLAVRYSDYFNESYGDRRFMSYYAQATYMLQEKYIATGSFRIDQSNLFGVDPKYKNKPLWSAGLSWRIDKEDFLQPVSWVNELKLRAATGFNGNVPGSNNGPFLILESGINSLFYAAQPLNRVLSPENQSLRWETTRNYNFGLDYSLFKGRVSGTIDWYSKLSTDVFGQFDADPTTGFNQYFANTASIRNRGLEIMVNTSNIRTRNFEWRSQVTASFNKNRIMAVKATEYANSQYITSAGINVQDQPMNAVFSYNYGGLTNMGKPFVYDSKGNQKILNFYGASVVDVNFNDLIYSGTTTPKYVLGWNNQFTLGAFDLSFLFMYYGGHVMRAEQPNPNNLGSYTSNPIAGSLNYWRKAGDEANTIIPGFTPGTSLDPYYYSSYARYGYQYASRFVRKADYIRLRDLILTYNAKLPFMQKMGFTRTQIRLQAQNMFRYTFSGNDIDPEAIDRQSGIRRLPQQPFYSVSLFTNF
ncbi:SusC/RagA family TonB-linked outer membrane protein [Filimonas effusa]|uniref:SusC/RagA family TonB-linked outer membrane protein n=1 Tax=Filimonas effusa TaxID=2508721 RepID=A0A4Q1D460_9BACT|nr:SusC/RagA family TonB-linked outer membrane protein [Filimonas effusa]RXK83215.1 SusC/RagA family TonB-linked outer membrane protein [Filimonas effusa]